MTAIAEAAQCVTQRDLGGDVHDVPVLSVFGKGVGRGIDLNDEFRPGPDAADTRCARRLPDGQDAFCDQPVPWAGLNPKDLINASGADLIRRVQVTADEGESAPGRYSLTRTLAYVLVGLADRDPKRLGQYLQEAFQRCANGTVQIVHGVSAVVGAVPAAGTADKTPAVAFLTPDRVAWVVFDGRPWTRAEQDQALAAIAKTLN